MINLEMERKLNDLKDEFCKYKCFCKDEGMYCGETKCKKCTNEEFCDEGYVSSCKICKVEDFIKFIRDEI